MNKELLDFTFIAEVANGTLIKQTPEDVSRLDPQNRSSFYDVLQCGSPVIKFSLVGKGHIFTVDMRDGHIEVDGTKTYTKVPVGHGLLDVIYYVQVERSMGVELEVTHTGIQQQRNVMKPVRRFYIGWQTNVNGKNYKFELGVD